MIQFSQIEKALAVSPSEYSDGLDHLKDELNRLDAILARRVELFNQELNSTKHFVRAAPDYVTFQEVEYLLNSTVQWELSNDIDRLNELVSEWNQRLARSIKASEELGQALPLSQLADRFNLSGIELAIVIICLAPELNRKYDRIYAFLQDNIARSRPSIDLVLRVLFDSETDRWRARVFFDSQSSLMQQGIIEIFDHVDASTGSSELTSCIRLDPRIVNFIMGVNHFPRKFEGCACLHFPEDEYMPALTDSDDALEVKNLLSNCVHSEDKSRLWLSLTGCGVTSKLWFSLDCIRSYSDALLVIDCQSLLEQRLDDPNKFFRMLCRESLLLQLPLYLKNVASLFLPESRINVESISDVVFNYTWLVFSDMEFKPSLFAANSCLYHAINFRIPNYQDRKIQWQSVLQNLPIDNASLVASEIAEKYKMNPEQILSVANKANTDLTISGDAKLVKTDLFKLCRAETAGHLGKLATRVSSQYQWDDLVLPADEKNILRAICRQVRNRVQVFKQWGFSKKISYGAGLSVLFTGKPGTGKTMACQVIGNELDLDVFKVDLSGMVSKYIGETEKNLDVIFEAALTSNAILFFDEADALFGKRSEVNDAHDRYANIETSYLLQKIEEYNGIVVLATNFKNNIDDAFMRRCRFVLDFPFPEPQQRRAIWEKILPREVPLARDLDFDWLAKQINLPGGNIKNIVLNAAFYAAEEKTALNMNHFELSSRDEYRKIGRLWDQRIMAYRK